MRNARLYVSRDRETGVLWLCMAGLAPGDQIDFWRFDDPEQCERWALSFVVKNAPELSGFFVDVFMGCADVLRRSQPGDVTDFGPLRGGYDLRPQVDLRVWVREIARQEGRSRAFVQRVIDGIGA